MILVNGKDTGCLDVGDRGLHYGDGLFETLAVREGMPELWGAHLRRLVDGCARLGIPAPDGGLLAREAGQVCNGVGRGVLKIIVTRGGGGRGYRPPQHRLPPLGIFELWVGAQVSDENHSIQAFCHGSPLLLAAIGGEHTRPSAMDQ